MENRKKLLLLMGVIIGFLVLSFVSYLSFRKTGEKTSSSKALISFSEEFIKEFSTYDYKNTSSYNKKLEKFIEPKYHKAFIEKFHLPEESDIPDDEKINYSKYVSAEVKIVTEEEAEATIDISYIAKKTDAPFKAEEFEDKKSATITVVTEGGKPYISSFQFSTNE